MKNLSVTIRNPRPLEILAVRPKSDAADFKLMLNAFGCLNEMPFQANILFNLLVSLKNQPKGVPTLDDHFVDLLSRARATAGAKGRFALLGQARHLLIKMIINTEITRYRERGRLGGRTRKAKALTPTRGQIVVAIAKTDFKNMPGLKGESTEIKVHHVAKKIAGYSSLPPTNQKHFRDYVRKILLANKLVRPKKLSSRLP